MADNMNRFLDTDMGNSGAKHFGMEKPPHNSLDNSMAIAKLVSSFMTRLTRPWTDMEFQIDAAARETHSGKFLTFDGDEVPW